MQHEPYTGGVAQSELRNLIDKQIQDGTLVLPPLAPKSIEDLITDLVTQGIKQHQALQFHGLPIVAYAELPYQLNDAAVMYIKMRLQEVFAPGCTITPYLNQANPKHVAFQIKVDAT